MKKSLITGLAFAAILLAGCAESKDIKVPTGPDETVLTSAFSRMGITVPTGKIVVALNDGDTVAVCKKSQTIIIPHDCEVSLEEIDANEGNNKLNEQNQIFEVVAFEDSKKGDYDYNDLVIHARLCYSQETGILKIRIQPVAMGAMKDFGLGVSVGYRKANGEKVDINRNWNLTDDCRADFFEGRQGFINTVNGGFYNKYVNVFEHSIDISKPADSSLVIDWYLNVDNARLYAVSEYYPCALKSNLRPYGLIFTRIHQKPYVFAGSNCGFDWWNYPQETVSIDEVYPFSARFFEGTSTDYCEFCSPSCARYYNAIGDGVMPGAEIQGTAAEATATYAINFNQNVIVK